MEADVLVKTDKNIFSMVIQNVLNERNMKFFIIFYDSQNRETVKYENDSCATRNKE